MNILIFGGTTEGRILARRLSGARHGVTVSVATELGAEELRGIDCHILTGRLEPPEMAALARGFNLVIDATHPYAVRATENIRTACETASVPLRRVLRAASEGLDCIRVDSCAAAAEYLRETAGNVLIATGSKELGAYGILAPERLYPRVLPTHEALTACEALGVPHGHILALQGPFSLDMNLAMLRQYQIRYLVTKDGGAAGGFEEKREAARMAGAALILVGRPEDSGETMEQLLLELEAMA